MKTQSLFLLASLITLTGCSFSLGRDEPAIRHYVLGESLPMGVEHASGQPTGATIGLRHVQIADYLDVPFVVVRRGPQRITFSDFHRWGESLTKGVNRSVAGHLVARGPVRTVDSVPWPVEAQHDYLVEIQVLRFEGLAPEDPEATTGEIHMVATWKILHPEGGQLLQHGTTEHRRPGWTIRDYEGLVDALEEGLSSLADEIISALGRVAAQ